MHVLTVVEKSVRCSKNLAFLHFARYVPNKQTKDIRI